MILMKMLECSDVHALSERSSEMPHSDKPIQYLDVLKTKTPNPVPPVPRAAQDLQGYV
ncbi:MAG: hypothetical protein AAF327_14095 [Cyanobacteria bacterium P01_A01_bin.37]